MRARLLVPALLLALLPVATPGVAVAVDSTVEFAAAIGSDLRSSAGPVSRDGGGSSTYTGFFGAVNLGLWHPAGDIAPGDYAYTDASALRLGVIAGTVGCFFGMSGSLTVIEARFAPDGTPLVLALDWAHDCANNNGSLSGSLRWHSDAPYAAVTATRIDAGRQPLSSTTSWATQLSNVGSRPVQLGAPSVTGAQPGSWSVTAATCPDVLDVGATCTVTVSAHPEAAGYRFAELRLPADLPGGAVRTSLLVQAIAPPSAPIVTVAPAIGAVQVRWSAVSSETPLSPYRITRSEPGGPTTVLGTVRADWYQRYDDRSAVPGRTYVYGVDTSNLGGQSETGLSASVTVPRREVVVGAQRVGEPGGRPFRDWPEGEHSPARSLLSVTPDGRAEALSGADGLVVSTASGTRVLGAAALSAEPSPDSRSLLVLRQEFSMGTAVPRLSVVPITGGASRAVPVPTGTRAGSWLDNRFAVVTVDVGGRRLLRLDTLTGATAEIPGSAGAFGRAAVSPNLRTIAFVRLDGEQSGAVTETSLHLLPAAGGTPTQVAADLRLPWVSDWRPDGAALLVGATVVIDHLGSEANRLMEVPLDGSARTTWIDGGYGENARYRYAAAATPDVRPSDRASLQPTSTVTWTVRPEAVGYEARVRRARWDGGYASWTAVTPGSGVVRASLAAGGDTCTEVRSRDLAGRVSPWVGRCVARPLDDRSLSASTGWTRQSSQPNALGGSLTATRRAGATLTLGRVVMTRGWLLAVRCPGCGSLTVSVGGRLLGTVSLASTVTQRMVLVPLPSAGATRTGALVLKATSSKPVYVDGLAVAHS